MKLADLSIRRAVFAVMLVSALIVFGLLSYPRIGVDLFPDVEFPVVTVTVVYPGGDPETMESKVADPVEEAINTLSGIKALRSTNMEGVSQIVVEFELDVPTEQAVQDIRDRVSGVQSQLPEGTETPLIQKFDVGAAPIMAVALAGDVDPRALTALADDVVKERIQRVPGVGGVDLVGGREREIRVLVDASKLSGLGLTVQDVSDAIRSQNFALPAGSFELGTQEIAVKTKGEVKTAQEVADILLLGVAGASLRVRDVAEVLDGMEDARSASFLDGRSAVSLVVRKQSGANTVAVAREVHEALDEIRPRIEKAGATLAVPTDNAVYIARSIHDVQFDLLFGGLLAVAIILLFLRDVRATLISAVAIPTSVIASFAFMEWLGFTFNNMTMLALTLSIGILIDDAIVVIENIHRRLEAGETPMQAASNGTAQIFLAVLATTSSILAVFVPVAFMKGIVGRFFYQFGITVSVAVAVSMLVSFTLTPMLSSRFLRASHGTPNLLSRAVERILAWLDERYGRAVSFALRHRLGTVVVAVLAFAGSIVMVSRVQSEFLPPEDRAQFSVNVELPTGTALSATSTITESIAKDVREHAPGVVNTFTTIGGGVAQGQTNIGQIQVVLTPSKQRAFHQEDLMAWVRARLGKSEDAIVTVQQINVVGGQAFRAQPVQFYVRGSDMEELVRVTESLKQELASVRGLVDLDTTYRGGKPELAVTIDREAAASLGVPVANVAATVRALMAGDAVSEVKDGVHVYDITVQLPESQQAALGDLSGLQVRSTTGRLVDLANVVEVTRSEGPSQIERQARQRQVTVLAGLEGLPLGEATKAVTAAARKTVPPHLVTGFVGMADTMGESFQYMGIALILAVILVYMILAAQFDSFVQPLTIMLSLPLSVVGAFGALYLTGMTLNIFSMIGVIMLMGLVTKNAILLVDFANQLRTQGKPVHEALVEAGIIRLRPIAMTTAAMIFGMLPVALAVSEGGEVRAPMAVCVIGGLVTSTLLTLIVVPVAYSATERMVTSGPVRWLQRRLMGGAAMAVLVLSASPAWAQTVTVDAMTIEPGGLTADETARRALAASSSVQEKRAALDAAEARIRQTTLEFVPKVGLKGSYTRLSHVAFPPTFGNLDLPENQWAATARLDVPLSDYLLRLSDASDSADASRRAARLARDAEMRKVALDARVLYYNYVRAHAQRAIAASALERARLRLADAEAGVAVGRLAAADQMRIEALVAKAELGVHEAESVRALIGAQLAIVMDDEKGGVYPLGEGVPEPTQAVEVTPADTRRSIVSALQRRLEMKAIDALHSAYQYGENAARASAWPRLDGFADYTYANPNQRYFPPENEFNGSWAAGVALSYSLDAPFTSDAHADELAADAASARARRRAVEAAIVNEVISAQLEVGTAHAALRAGETSVRAAEESSRVTTDLFRVGRATPSDLIEAESELRAAKLASVDARIDLAIASLRLRYAVGD